MKFDELEKAAKAATPGPWVTDEADHDSPYQNIKIGELRQGTICTVCIDDAPVHDYNAEQRANAAYIAAANPAAILELLAELHRLAAESEMRRFALQDEMQKSKLLTAELEDQKQATKTWENEAERRSDRYTKCAAELEELKKAISEAQPVAQWKQDTSDGLPMFDMDAPTAYEPSIGWEPLSTLKGIK